MTKRISSEIISDIKKLRAKGWSLPELKREFSNVGYGTIYRHVKEVEILPEFEKIWAEKRKGSVSRMKRAEIEAYQKAKKIINRLSFKERLLFLTALYWGEGGKKDFNFTNSDPEMIRVFTKGLRKILGVNLKDLRVSIRIYEDLDTKKCLNYWSTIIGVRPENFVNVDILKGKKSGKLSYGLCRVRVRKGGNMLKYLAALRKRTIETF